MAGDSTRGSDDQVSALLADWAARDPSARDRLVPLVLDELRHMARRYLRNERPNHTLQTTELVNELYLRIAGLDRIVWRDRTHFFALAATLIRRILVDHARERGREKRGAGLLVTSISGHDVMAPEPALDVLALNDALDRLADFDARQSRIVELRYFAGLTIEDTAQALGVSPATVKREWTSARAWLHHAMALR